MFLCNKSVTGIPQFDIIDRYQFVKRIRYPQKVRDGLLIRFRKEYLEGLVHNGQKRVCNLIVDDIVIVLIGTNNTNQTSGPLRKMFPRKDGVHKVTKVNWKGGELIIRPLQTLFPLKIPLDKIRKNRGNKEQNFRNGQNNMFAKFEKWKEDRRITEEEK